MFLWVPTPTSPILHTITFSVKVRGRAWSPPQPSFRKDPLSGKAFFSHMTKPEEDKGWQNYFREEWMRKMLHQGHSGLFPWMGPVIVQTFFLYQPPKNWWPGKEKTSTPDDDNMGKQAVDALTPKAKGGYGAWLDDRQIISRSSAKFYHPKGEAVVMTMRLLELVERPRKRGKT